MFKKTINQIKEKLTPEFSIKREFSEAEEAVEAYSRKINKGRVSKRQLSQRYKNVRIASLLLVMFSAYSATFIFTSHDLFGRIYAAGVVVLGIAAYANLSLKMWIARMKWAEWPRDVAHRGGEWVEAIIENPVQLLPLRLDHNKAAYDNDAKRIR